MPPKLFTPPTPSPSDGRASVESMYSTPQHHPPPPRRPRISPPPSSSAASEATIRTTYAPAIDLGGTPTPTKPLITIDSTSSDFISLHIKAQAQTHVFRVHSPEFSPASSLIWTGIPGTSGFFPYNAHRHVPPSVYMQGMARTPIDEPGWENGNYVRHTMVDHINGKMRQGLLNIPSHLEERPGTPEDEKSPWISGTRSLMWAIWEVARRLAWDHGVVGLAVIKREGMPAEEDEGWGEEEDEDDLKGFNGLEKWRKADERKRRGYVGKEVMLLPFKPISFALGTARAGEMSVSMKEAYETALRSAKESEEVLFYGRVFAESIERNIEFSADNLPLELPSQFYKPRKSDSNRAHRLISPTGDTPAAWKTASPNSKPSGQGENALEGWLSRLVWDPRCDEYERAVQKVVERRRQLYMSRGVTRDDCPIAPL